MKHASLIFLHIPKAAGTTLTDILRKNYPPGCTFRIEGTRMEWSAEQLKKRAKTKRFCLLTGHQWFGNHVHMPQPCTYVTLLRHPVDRMVSHYCYVKRSKGHYLNRQVTERNMTLYDYVVSGFGELRNGMTRFIAAENPPSLEKAKRHLRKHFAVVGLTERFDDSVQLMARLLGWKHTAYANLNVTRNRPALSEIPARTRKAIEAINNKDMELYEWVRKHFEEQLRGR